MPVKSYAWGHRLDAAVPDTGTIEVRTPGFHGPENYQTDDTHVVMGGTVIPDGSYTTAWAGDFTSVTVTNGTGHSWPPGETVYVTVAGKVVDPADIQGTLEALDARISANEAALTEQAGQIDANTSAIAGNASAIAALDTRVAALEGAIVTTGGTLEDRVTQNESDIQQLDTRVTVLEREQTTEPSPPAKEAHNPQAEHEKHDNGAKGDEERSRHREHPRERPGTPHWEDEGKTRKR